MLPLLGGFFTYKLAVIGRWAASELAAAQAARGRSGELGSDEAPALRGSSSPEQPGVFDARSVDRVFNKGMLAR